MPPLNQDQLSSIITSQDSVDANCVCRAKCVLVGDGAVGKTSLIVSYTTNGYPTEYVPTAFDNYSVVVNVNSQPIRLQICDTAGQDDFDSLRPLCYPNTDVFLLCFSVVCPTSFYNIAEKWIPDVKHYCSKAPFLLVGTQCDLRTDVKVLIELANYNEQPVSEREARLFASKIGAISYLECSALTQKNLKEVFDSAILAALKVRKPDLIAYEEPKVKLKLSRNSRRLIPSDFHSFYSEKKKRGWKKFCCFI